MTTPKYYFKFLDHDRMPAHGGRGQWPATGIWTEEVEPIPCVQGWHLCRKQDILHWMHETLWVVEADGDVVDCDDKVVARRARLVRQVEEWHPRNQRLFAADCAEHVLKNYEDEYPGDTRPRNAIETARRFTIGEATEEQLGTACYSAWAAAGSAWSAASNAAGYAAGSAARSAGYDTRSAAWSAARSAAEVAEAEFSAAWSAAVYERAWQIEHIFKEYLKLDPNDFH